MPVQLDKTVVGAQVPGLLRTLAGPAAVPHPEQLAAIQAVVADRRRVLVVQRTGWGKSAVYFLATRLLRDAGAGPTFLVSPLLALMRDEAHCISDWGHDFRPDYRRIAHILRTLGEQVPVLGTPATANARVVADVAEQLGSDTLTLRGPLGRASLVLSTVALPSAAERLAWLATQLPQLPGSGIVYCL